MSYVLRDAKPLIERVTRAAHARGISLRAGIVMALENWCAAVEALDRRVTIDEIFTAKAAHARDTGSEPTRIDMAPDVAVAMQAAYGSRDAVFNATRPLRWCGNAADLEWYEDATLAPGTFRFSVEAGA